MGTAALLLLATVACGGPRPTASSATAGPAAPTASVAVAPEVSGLHLATLRLIGELRSPLWLDLYVSDVKGIAAATTVERSANVVPTSKPN